MNMETGQNSLAIPSNNLLLQVFLLLKVHSKENFLVGGCVRDLLMGKTHANDWDIVTDTHMDTLEKSFAEAGWKVDATGKQFLVLNVSKDHVQFEIANFRKDGEYSDGRRPDQVEIGDIFEDAARRDFTVNALYLDPFNGAVLDPNSKGIKDIDARILRFIGRPEDRIKEDRLRIYRFYRFLQKGFHPDIRSLRACRTMFRESYPLITPERVREELEKMVGL